LDITIKVPSGEERVAVLGPSERNLKMLREALGIQVTAREGRVFIGGPKPAVIVARNVLEALLDAADKEPMGRQEVLDMIAAEASMIGRKRAGWSIEGAPSARSEPEVRGHPADHVHVVSLESLFAQKVVHRACQLAVTAVEESRGAVPHARANGLERQRIERVTALGERPLVEDPQRGPVLHFHRERHDGLLSR
jgi:phosphate starvation-inducible protein PhoH